MILAVPEEVLHQTTRCDRDMACQKPGWEPCGNIVRKVDGGLLEEKVESARRRACRYHVAYGGGYFCTCPTRIEIHKRYEV